ncbi:MAG: carboxypeptidase-like regulatory domain-containing protein, partial [bacterium]|nr:carboxypeptidase-like regulatory domain-containing protein [bacterium]
MAGVTRRTIDGQDIPLDQGLFRAALFDEAAGDSFFSGTVIDDATGRPLAGARVVVPEIDGVVVADPKPEQTTGEDGRFLITVPSGTHDVTIGRAGYSPVFRIVTTSTGEGTEVFDPRLTPAAESATVNASGAALEFGEAALEVPAGALSTAAAVVVTPLDEQGLPALLPYGWSPRGAVWLDSESDFSTAATLRIPAQSASGTLLTAAELDLGTLQWYSLGTFAVSEGGITVPVTTSGAYAAVEADSGPLAPPAAIDGEVLGSSPQPLTAWATTAELSFDP